MNSWREWKQCAQFNSSRDRPGPATQGCVWKLVSPCEGSPRGYRAQFDQRTPYGRTQGLGIRIHGWLRDFAAITGALFQLLVCNTKYFADISYPKPLPGVGVTNLIDIVLETVLLNVSPHGNGWRVMWV